MAESKYELLIRLATEACDKAVERMNEARKRMDSAIQKLDQLNMFLNDYLVRRIEHGERGMGAAQWVDYQRFIERLRDAVTTQVKEVDFAKILHQEMVENWHQARKKVKALEKLLEQEKLRQQQKEAKREQKQTDEFAARIFRSGKS